MTITGEALIGGASVMGNGAPIRAFDPAAGVEIEPPFHAVDDTQVGAACELARAAFDPLRQTSDEQRARFLEMIGEQIVALGESLVVRAMQETGLPRARLEGERARTVGQLRLFAALLREGSWADARIDSALPDRQPPRPDLRLRMVGLGPVAVFAASNFPLAFSVAGGDTAAAFAAGCPVVLKAHSAHPGTSELVGRAIVRAAAQCDLPLGVFALLTGSGSAIGQALVRHPAIQAVGFTGSRSGGTALMEVAAARPQPIPVYAEMSSINPVFLLPHALAARAEAIGAGFAASLTMSSGQLCTNPGLVLGLAGPDFDRFCDAASTAVAAVAPATMLSRGIASGYHAATHRIAAADGVETLVRGDHQDCQGGPALFRASGAAFLAEHGLSDEMFGPASLLVACADLAEMAAIAEQLEGQLTATLQLDEGDFELARALLPTLERRVGRILANGFPTGVEVSHAIVHGGPFPSTSDGRSTSVGTAAITRFLRPVCYQNMPQALLPAVLRDDCHGTWRRHNGELQKA